MSTVPKQSDRLVQSHEAAIADYIEQESNKFANQCKEKKEKQEPPKEASTDKKK